MAQNEKACRGRRCGRLSKIIEQRLGGGVPLFHGRPWEEVRYDQPETLREEEQRFDE
jgi:hypothetical protein